MEIYITENYNEMSRKAALIIQASLTLKPDAVLGLATGSSPLGVYEFLSEWAKSGNIDFSNARTINLDEYFGLGGDNPQSYRYFMDANLFSKINIKKVNTYLPNGLEADEQKESARYDELIRGLGGIDVQLLGIGGNGHIGFNEPSDEFVLETHKQPLAQSTIEANKRFFEHESDVPRFAYTMGIGAIMDARRVLLIASGAGKAEALRDAIHGPVTPRLPASILRLHRNVTIVADKEAARLV